MTGTVSVELLNLERRVSDDLRAANDRLREEFRTEEKTVYSCMERLKNQEAEIARLRGHLHQHFAFVRFVHLWTNRENVTDAERISVIKHHPFLARCMGESGVDEQYGNDKQ